MRPIATTRVQLFPDAPVDAPLAAGRPPKILFSARAWYRAVMLLVIAWAGLVLVDIVVVWTMPRSVQELLGGPALRRVGWGALLAAGISYGALRLVLRRGADAMLEWNEYARQRGLQAGSPSAITTTRLDVFQDGRDRSWTGMLRGRLHGDVEAVIGATAWTTGSGKYAERHEMYFVYLRLPRVVAELYPASSLARYLRGFSNVHLGTRAATTELRFESHSLDNACRIRVAGSTDEVHWREVFDPVTLAGLDEIYDGQWQHVGEDIAFCAGARRPDRASVEALDALCLTAVFMYERMLRAARGDVRPEALAG